MAGALGADAVEVDVRLTGDDVPVLIHDAKFQPDGGSLEEALEVLPAGVVMAIDVKEARAAPQVVELVRQVTADRVQVWARSLSVLRRFVEELPDVERALLRDTRRASAMPRYVEDAARCGAHAISPRWVLISRELVAEAHSRGLKVYSMAESAESQASKLAMGLDGVVTDWPEEALTQP